MGAGRPRTPPDSRAVYRRRRAVAGLAAVAVVVAAITAVRGGDPEVAGEPSGAAQEAESPPAELPGGGRELFPAYRVVSFYGAPQDERLGELGIGSPASAAQRLKRQAAPYETDERPVMLAFELIATIAEAGPGGDGLYRTRQTPAVIRRYLDAAREAGALLVLDIQPGRSDFMSEVRALDEFLAEPDVGLALDPEWRMGPEEVPGQTIGSVEAAEVNRVARYLARLVDENDLPEKLLLVHQFTSDMISDRDALESPPGVALTLNVDGFGTAEEKRMKYEELVREDGPGGGEEDADTGGDGAPAGGGDGADASSAAEDPDAGGGRADRPRRDASEGSPIGFKLFYEEDTGVMTPRQVLRLRPPPDVVVYE